jgi:mannose-6-phosphate isomerase-like protein (cupin superfamily)
MKKKDFIRSEKGVMPIPAQDGVSIFEIFNPSNSKVQRMSLAFGALEPGESSDPHFHKIAEEYFIILSGCGKILLGNGKRILRSFHIKKGDYIFIPSGISHGLINPSTRQRILLVSVESPSFVQNDIFFLT